MCHCDPGYGGDDCAVSPRVVIEAGLRMPELLSLSVVVLVGGIVAGSGMKAAADRRRRLRLMRFIEEGGDGQGPFVSEVRQSVIG